MSTSGNIKISQLIAHEKINGTEILPISYLVGKDEKGQNAYFSYSVTSSRIVSYADAYLGLGENISSKVKNLVSYVEDLNAYSESLGGYIDDLQSYTSNTLGSKIDKLDAYSGKLGSYIDDINEVIGGNSGESLTKKIDNALGYIGDLESYTNTLGGYIEEIQDTIGGSSGESLIDRLKKVEDEIPNKQEKGLIFNDVEVSEWEPSTKYSSFIFESHISLDGVTADDFVEVIFNMDDATSGVYAPICESLDGKVVIYANYNAAITIPSIVVTRKN